MEKKEDPISISELKEKYKYTNKNLWPIIIILFVILCLGIYLGYHYYLNNPSVKDENSNDQVRESITQPVKQENKELTCEEEFSKLLPDNITLTKETGNDKEWIFNPIDNNFNNYTNKIPLLPQRTLFYQKVMQNEYIAQEGINSNDYFKYSSPTLVVDYNPILIDNGSSEELITIKGISMSKKEFSIQDPRITNCVKT